MLKLNTPKGKQSSPAFEKLAGNTRLIPPNSSQSTSNKTPQTTDKTKLQKFSSLNKPSQTFHNHLDWSTWNFTELNEKQFRELIQRTVQGLVAYETNKPWSCGSKAKKYENTLTSPIGLRGGYTSYRGKDSTDTFYDVSITMSGEYFSPLSAIEQWELCRYLYINYSPECLRIDTSVDDYSLINIPLEEMLKAYERGDYFDFREHSCYTSSKDANNSSTTHYFGAKGSKRRVKVYSHNGECLRLETQFRGKYAQIAFEAIATLEFERETELEQEKIIQKTLGGIAVGAIDFRDKSKLKNQKKASKDKTNRLEFWQDFSDKVGGVHLIKLNSKKPDLSKHQAKLYWLKRCASKTLAILFYVLGKERFVSYLYRLIEHGESKFTQQDIKLIKYLQNHVEYFSLD